MFDRFAGAAVEQQAPRFHAFATRRMAGSNVCGPRRLALVMTSLDQVHGILSAAMVQDAGSTRKEGDRSRNCEMGSPGNAIPESPRDRCGTGRGQNRSGSAQTGRGQPRLLVSCGDGPCSRRAGSGRAVGGPLRRRRAPPGSSRSARRPMPRRPDRAGVPDPRSASTRRPASADRSARPASPRAQRTPRNAPHAAGPHSSGQIDRSRNR